MDNPIREDTPTILSQDSLDPYLAHFGVDDFDIEGYIQEVNTLLDTPYDKTTLPWTIKYEPLPMLASTPIAPSLESPPILELKSLPTTLKYPFLGSNDTIPVIIASDLTLDQEAQLVGIL